MLLESSPTLTLGELNSSLREVFPRKPQVCNMTISRALDGELITVKLCRNVAENRNSNVVKDARIARAQ